ncbi:hypothetical protein RMN57_09270 [Kitasatospora sp. CM 4170]|uniref:Antibiotic biosynthesis monooxygenase n=1 Tax=Kitasatospora aburaviensis TaxID=67265 RepID=A0ABW1ESL5_9ACTN|nr:antibiotic biosynthesis monooxygenase [Kitasatospora sp. CM 4170]WNM44899.1 hypothetical protein RMN57_09270 [Kitasatospora sp. CM 4170]
MYVRTGYFTGDPSTIDQALDGLRAEAVGLLSAQPGYRGYGLFADRERGVILMGSWWDTAQHERDSAERLRQRRDELLAPFATTTAVEVLEATVVTPPAPVGPGAGFRLVRFDFEPDRGDELAEGFRAGALPALQGMDGFVSAALLLNRAVGRGSVGVVFADRAALAASRGPQAAARAKAAASGAVVRSLEELDVVLLERS